MGSDSENTKNRRNPSFLQKKERLDMAQAKKKREDMDVATVYPLIPNSILTEEDMAFFGKYGFEAKRVTENDKSKTYLFAPKYATLHPDLKTGIAYYEDKLIEKLQEIIKRSNGELRYLYVKVFNVWTSCIPHFYTAHIIFITTHSCKHSCTETWLLKQQQKYNRNNKPARKKGRKQTQQEECNGRQNVR